MKTKRLFALFLTASLLATTACSSGTSTAPVETEPTTSASTESTISDNPFNGTADADMVTVDFQSEPPGLNSLLNLDSVSSIILMNTMSGLVKMDADNNPVPAIAESWEISDDNLTLTFHLRKDSKWSNGESVTAQDFVYAWQMIMTPETASPSAYTLCENIKNGYDFYEGKVDASQLGVKAIDSSTLQVELASAVPYTLSLFTFVHFFPLNQKAYESIGADNYGTDKDNIVTNGAYNVSEWIHDDHILIEKNPDYFNAAAIDVPKVKFTMLGDRNARMNAFQAGQLDVMDIIGDQIGQLESKGTDVVNRYMDNAVFMLQFSKNNPATANAKIAQALGMSLDIQSLCDNVFQDGSLAATGLVPDGITGADGNAYSSSRGKIAGYDAAKAKSLLDEGLKELNMDISELKLTYTASDSEIGKLQGDYFQQEWKKNLGIDVTIELMPFKAQLEKVSTGEFDITFNGWLSPYNDALNYLNLFTTDEPNNYGNFSSPKFDEWYSQALTESDAPKRQELMIQAEKLVIEEGGIYPLYYTCIVYATSNKVEGIACSAFQKYNFTNGAKLLR